MKDSVEGNGLVEESSLRYTCCVCKEPLRDVSIWVDDEGVYCKMHATLRRVEYMRQAAQEVQDIIK